MAGIGFELKRAIRDESPVKRAGGYFGAAFSSSGSMIIGIIVFCVIQYTAGIFGAGEKTKDMFMCYVTNTMFFSMICTSALNLVLSRYVSDRIYLDEKEKIMPSLIGGISLAGFIGGALFLTATIISGLSTEETVLLFFLFQALSCCWILMNYISILREYKQIIYAYLSSFVVSAVVLLFFIISGEFSLFSMILIITSAFVMVDIILFKAVYKRYTLFDNSVLGFLCEFGENPSLALSGLFIMLGTLGHFFVIWFFSDLGESVNFLFRYSSIYDFPVIVAYFCTIPAAIYFVTLFETDFSKKYKSYFTTLGVDGNTDSVYIKRKEMFESLGKGLKNICKIQIITCLLFITVGSQLLYVLNIGMTERMLNNFRLFCIGYSAYYIGYTVMLLHLYFMNEKRVAKSSLAFLVCVIASSLLSSFLGIDYAGLGFFISSVIFASIVSVQLFRYLSRLEYNVLCPQPIRSHYGKSFITVVFDKFSKHLDKADKTPFVIRKKSVIIFMILLFCVIFSGTSLAISAYIESRTPHFYPEYSTEVLNSPRAGLAPWAENKETVNMKTSLVYVELKWSDWEPIEGEFNIDFVNDFYNLKYYRENNRQVVFRFICDNPTSKKHMDIPEWLYKLTGGDGQFYHNSYGKGYSPNYNNKEFIKKHEQAVRVLGEVYGNDDFFTYVELGSLGHWGEWHTNYESGISRIPEYEVRKQYINPYISAFPNAQILIRYPLIDAKDYGFGFYNDLTGDYKETIYWLNQMKGGIWEQTGLKEQLNCEDNWKKYPVGGEFASTHKDKYFMVDGFSMTLEAIRLSHQSFIGPKIIADESDADYKRQINEILRTLGYRFTVDEVILNLADKDNVDIKLKLRNKGIAPIYKPYNISLELYDDENNSVWKKTIDYNVAELMPGKSKTVSAKVKKDSLDDDENYQLMVSIISKDGKSKLPLALKKQFGDKLYPVAEFDIK